MARPDHKRLDDMREACELIASLTARGRAAFEEDVAILLALERALEVLGEAANHVSDKVRVQYPTIPWTEITRLRIRLAHHYHRSVPDRIWIIATDEVPAVVEALGPLQEDEGR